MRLKLLYWRRDSIAPCTAGLDRFDPDIEMHGGFVRAHAFHVAKHEDGAKIGRQPVDGTLEQLASLLREFWLCRTITLTLELHTWPPRFFISIRRPEPRRLLPLALRPRAFADYLVFSHVGGWPRRELKQHVRSAK